jgi:hypothetical protein
MVFKILIAFSCVFQSFGHIINIESDQKTFKSPENSVKFEEIFFQILGSNISVPNIKQDYGQSYLDYPGLIVKTEDCPVEGVVSESYEGVRMFRGMPYAQPPINNLRWQDPRRNIPWGNDFIYDASFFKKYCLQSVPAPFTSEDCLYLDVFTPTLNRFEKDELLPVVVWFHGGAYMVGSGSMLLVVILCLIL